MDRCFQKRALVVLLGLASVFSVLSVRLVQLQWPRDGHQGDQPGAIALLAVPPRARPFGKEILAAERGAILDRRGHTLADNQREFRLVADRHQFTDERVYLPVLKRRTGFEIDDLKRNFSAEENVRAYLAVIAGTVGPALGVEPDRLIATIESQPELDEITLARDLDDAAMRQVREAMEAEGIRGVGFVERSLRFHPSPGYLTHVLGFVDADCVGRGGIEAAFDDVLTGVPGYRTFETDNDGKELPGFEGEVVPPVHGKNVRLTIDRRLQEILELTLDEVGDDPDEIYLPDLKAEKVSVVVMDPRTGEILALANRPHFDLATREGERTNAAVSHIYEPGSTFKLVALAGVLDRGLVGLQAKINCENGYWAPHRLEDHHPYGMLTTEELIVKSSNIGTFKLALQLGPRGFHEQARRLGFGQRTGIDLPFETAGLLYPPDKWSGTSFSRMAMGYEVAVTPVQMVAAYSAVANGGRLLRPQLVLGIGEEDDPAVQVVEPQVVGEAMSPRTADMVRQVLVKVTEKGGTATRAAIPGYPVAGKTGTAQWCNPKTGRYESGRYVLSFVGFVPADDPVLAAAVVVDSPKVESERMYGGVVAAPIFRRYMRHALAHLGVPPKPELLADKGEGEAKAR